MICVTGSNGKTTTKEMLVLFRKRHPGKIASTKGNLNNHIGVPLTLLGIKRNHEVAVVEIGTNSPGEIRF